MLKKVIIGDLGEIYTGNTPSKKNNEYYESNDIMFIKPDIMSFDIENIAESNEYISEKARDKARIVPANSLLVSCIGNIGKLAINKEEASFNQQINAIVHNENIVSSKYLAYLLKYNQKRLEAIANAPVVPIINKTQFSNFEVLIHESLDIQKKIVEVLDKAQDLIDKRKEQIKAMDELVKSRFIEMFGDPLTNNKNQKLINLDECIKEKSDLVDGPFGSSVNTKVDYIDNGEIPVIRTKNVNMMSFNDNDLKFMLREKYETVKRSQVLPGDIILTKVGTIGNVCIFPNKYDEAVLSTTGSCRIRVDENKINKLFLAYYLVYYRNKLLDIASAGVQPFLNMNHIKNISIFDVEYKLQNEFTDFIKQVDKLKSQMETSLKELEDNFNSLMQKAFKGELF